MNARAIIVLERHAAAQDRDTAAQLRSTRGAVVVAKQSLSFLPIHGQRLGQMARDFRQQRANVANAVNMLLARWLKLQAEPTMVGR
jgi:hypothetical protein